MPPCPGIQAGQHLPGSGHPPRRAPDEARLAFEKMLTGADQRRVQPRPCLRRVNHQDLVMTAHPPGGETRFAAKGSHGREGTPGSTRRSEPSVNPASFTHE